MCLVGLVRTSRLYIHIVGLLPWYMDLDWSEVDFEMRNMCLVGLVRTSRLYIHIVGLLPWYMDLAINLDRSESV